MGAPGCFILCGAGHIIGVIREHTECNEEHLEKLKHSRCLECGRIAKYSFCHYGDINDCLDKDSKLLYSGNHYIIPDTLKPNLNVDVKTLPGFNDELVTLLIAALKQSDLMIVHKSQIGRVKLPEVSEEYLHNLMMNR